MGGMTFMTTSQGESAQKAFNEAVQDALEEAKALLDAAACPSCDKSGAYYDSMGDIHQCQWCYEVQALKDRSE